jgi:glycerol-3-phosphate acyltransferase PlsY
MTWLALIAAYFIGGIPFGYLLVRWRTGQDVRQLGSGNIGATNVLRTQGRAFGVATLVLDIAKASFAVWLMDRGSGGQPGWMAAAAVAVLFGHAFPALLKFQGGKAVASFIGAFLYLTPVPLLLCVFVFVVCVSVTRFISFGSIMAAGLFPLAVWLTLQPGWPLLAAAVVSGALIVWRHRANLERLRAGTENRFSFSGKSRR